MTGRNGQKSITRTAPRSGSVYVGQQGGHAAVPLRNRAASAPLLPLLCPAGVAFTGEQY